MANHGRKFARALALAALCLLLGGCAMNVSTDKLYALPSLPAEYASLEAEINALGENEVLVAYFDACAAHDEANDNYIEVSGQKYVADKIKLDSKDMEQEILQLEQNIALWEKNIEDLAGNVTINWQHDSNGYTVGFYISGNGQNFYAILLEQVNNYIANLTEQIALQEEIVALAKAALDAALAGESTPAE